MKRRQAMWSIEVLGTRSTHKRLSCVLEHTRGAAIREWLSGYQPRGVKHRALPHWARPVQVSVEWECSP